MIPPSSESVPPLVADEGPFTEFPPGSHLTRWGAAVDF